MLPFLLSKNINSRILLSNAEEAEVEWFYEDSCLENPTDWGARKAAVHGVVKSQTWLSNFTFTFHFYALEKEMATHSSVLAWRIPGMEEPGGLPSLGSHRVGYDWSNLAAAAAWRPTRSFRANTQKRCPSHYRGLECKSNKSRNTWSNRQIWPWNVEWRQRLIEFCQESALFIANTLFQQHKRRLYT